MDSACFVIFTFICNILVSQSVLSLKEQVIIDGFQNYSTTANNKVIKCCDKNTGNNNNNCNITWDLLKQYRIYNRTGVLREPEPTQLDEKLLSEDRLNCRNEDALRYAIPSWSISDANSSTRSNLYSFFSPDGYFQFSEFVYPPEDFCVESITSTEITVVACNYASYCTRDDNSTTMDKNVCLHRCCNYGEVWSISSGILRCANSGVHKWTPETYFDLNSDDVSTSSDALVTLSTHPRNIISYCKAAKAPYTFQIPNPAVQNNKTLNPTRFGNHPFRMLRNGTVWMKILKRKWVQLSPGEYCIDGFQYSDGTYSGDSISDSVLFECKRFETDEEALETESQQKYSLSFGIVIFICIPFLLITEIVYILLWSKHNIHGWTVFSYITTLLVTYTLLGVSHFASATLKQQGTHGKKEIFTFCGALGVLSHFAFLCTFSWSSVLSFDLFCTFRALRPTRNGKSNGGKKYLVYCLFAFMVPTLIVSIGVFLDITYSTGVTSDVITPSYGKSVCFVERLDAKVYFVILPIAVLLGINFLLFCNTAYSVYKVKKSTQFASSSSTRKEANNQTFRLILKLLLINGAVWIVEIISWYFQKSDDEVGTISFILDVVNVLQAVAIFFLFVFKNDILESLRKKYPPLEGTINFAFKVKKWGTIRRQRENTTTITTDTSYNAKVNEQLPLSKV